MLAMHSRISIPVPRFSPARLLFPTLVLCGIGASFLPSLLAEAPPIIERQEIAKVWSGHPVGFAFLTEGERQYAAYYDEERNMTVAAAPLGSSVWTRVKLPSKVGWDSHNYIAMQVDREGSVHVSGNMHGDPLIYFRTRIPGDIQSLEQVRSMTGQREGNVTYPQFLKGNEGELIFTYRDGGSGNGSTLYNRYDEAKQSWSRLMDKPLFDGLGEVNAYPVGPQKGPDGYWHVTWVWRDTPDASTNHDLSYARSKNLANWETVYGKPIALPITPQTQGVVVDPIPAQGGIINGSGKIGFDDRKQVVISYHKFDHSGATQLYLARFENGAWVPHVVTQWTHRWEPKGMGTLSFDIHHSGLEYAKELGYYISFSNAKHGKGIWKVDPVTLQLGEKLPDNVNPRALPGELYKITNPGMKVNFARQEARGEDGAEYLLRWETLPYNRDRPVASIPAPTALELVKVGAK
jgi:hypothetical protein